MKYLSIILFLVLISACGLFKDAPTRPTRPAPKPKKERPTIPEPPKEEPKEEANNSRDSIVDLSANEEDAKLPTEETKPSYKLKEQYGIALYIPTMPLDDELKENMDFNNDDDAKRVINSWNNRFLQYAAGMELAFKQLAEESDFAYRLYLNSSGDWDESLLDDKELENASQIDVMIGGVKKETLNKLTDWSLQYGKMYVSPWLPQSPLLNSPFYFQMTPGIQQHCNQLVREIVRNHNPEEVTVIVNGENNDRVNCLQSGLDELEIASSFQEAELPELDDELDLSLYFNDKDTQVVVIPEDKDKGFIHGVLSRLSLIEDKVFIVYGMPTWVQYDLLYDYFEKMQVYISSAEFLDADLERFARFQKDYYAAYGTIPKDFAIKGYDHGYFLARQLHERGLSFLEAPINLPMPAFANPVIVPGRELETSEENLLLQMINEGVFILKYSDHRFQKETAEFE